jgi:UDP-N-acetylglucosamine:LPS N-acetylglucosamine transferase
VLEAYWNRSRPDMVVSLVPHFNRAMLAGLRRVSPTIPFVTIMTDIADYSPHFWIEPQEQFLICGSDRAVEQALKLGFPKSLIFQTSGMILNPCFYEPLHMDRSAERKKLGLEPELPTGLVMFGGNGSSSMRDVFRWLKESSTKIQLIFLCGHNAKLAAELRELSRGFPAHVAGFTKEVPYYMHLSDFFIGKPGPGSISEALSKRLPVIIDCNAWTLPQERYNAKWVREKEVGVVVQNHRQVASALAALLEPGQLPRFQERAAGMHNQAIFEIPRIFEKILSNGAGVM